ncbi:hypothetical protein [Cytobacillus oceanisediminis]|uniref:hypothetical protein n=1 Tax=Cytobacillus oceanisediminis TaxID=665099 RepID=UPI00373618C8
MKHRLFYLFSFICVLSLPGYASADSGLLSDAAEADGTAVLEEQEQSELKNSTEESTATVNKKVEGFVSTPDKAVSEAVESLSENISSSASTPAAKVNVLEEEDLVKVDTPAASVQAKKKAAEAEAPAETVEVLNEPVIKAETSETEANVSKKSDLRPESEKQFTFEDTKKFFFSKEEAPLHYEEALFQHNTKLTGKQSSKSELNSDQGSNSSSLLPDKKMPVMDIIIPSNGGPGSPSSSQAGSSVSAFTYIPGVLPSTIKDLTPPSMGGSSHLRAFFDQWVNAPPSQPPELSSFL